MSNCLEPRGCSPGRNAGAKSELIRCLFTALPRLRAPLQALNCIWALFLPSRAQGNWVRDLGDALGCSCAGGGVCGQQEARAGARGAGSAQRRRAHEPTRPRPDNTRRAGDYARAGAAPAPRNPGRQALRVGPASRCTAHGPRGRWSEYPATRAPPPQAPKERPRGEEGRPFPAAKGRDRAGPRAPGLIPNHSGGGHPDCTHTSLVGCKGERPMLPQDPSIQAGPPVGGRPPRACGISGVVGGPFLKGQGATRLPSPIFDSRLLALLSVPPASCPPRGLTGARSLLAKPIPAH